MGAYHAPWYINVTKHGNFRLSDGTFGTALCATGTPRRGLEQRSALLERPKGAMEQRFALLERPEGAMEQRLRYWNAPEGLTLCSQALFSSARKRLGGRHWAGAQW